MASARRPFGPGLIRRFRASATSWCCSHPERTLGSRVWHARSDAPHDRLVDQARSGRVRAFRPRCRAHQRSVGLHHRGPLRPPAGLPGGHAGAPGEDRATRCARRVGRRRARAHGRARAGGLRGPSDARERRRPLAQGPHPSVAIRTSVLRAAGGFPARYGDFAPWALAIALREGGHRLGFSSRSAVHHHYTGEVPELLRHVRDFALGEMRYWQEAPRELCSAYLDEPEEWAARGETSRTGARRLLRQLLAARVPTAVSTRTMAKLCEVPLQARAGKRGQGGCACSAGGFAWPPSRPAGGRRSGSTGRCGRRAPARLDGNFWPRPRRHRRFRRGSESTRRRPTPVGPCTGRGRWRH